MKYNPGPQTLWALGLLLIAVAAFMFSTTNDPDRPPPNSGSTAPVPVPAGTPQAASGTSAPDPSSTTADPPRATPHETAAASPAASPGDNTAAEPTTKSWPFLPKKSTVAAKNDDQSDGAPAVTKEVAFQALKMVGIDDAAEAIWLRAIRDPKMPEETRSDLIEDLNDQGYTDNNRPSKEDLPLILARMQLIEKLSPLEQDPVNRAAFEEAYKDLLAMFVRLGGQRTTGTRSK